MEGIYIRPSDFAERFSLDKSTVLEWINKGFIKAIVIRRPKRNHYRIPLSEVERFEKEQASNNEL